MGYLTNVSTILVTNFGFYVVFVSIFNVIPYTIHDLVMASYKSFLQYLVLNYYIKRFNSVV